MRPVEHAFAGLFGYEREPGSPVIRPPAIGLRLAADGASFDGETLALDLLLGRRLPAHVVRSFRRLPDALALVVEDAASGRAAAFPTIHPRVRRPAAPGPNYLGRQPTDRSFSSGWMRVPLEVRVSPATYPGASVFVTAVLQDLASNTLAVDLRRESVASFLGGLPFVVERDRDAGDESEVEGQVGGAVTSAGPAGAPVQEGIAVVPPGPILAQPGVPLELRATLAIAPDELAAGGAEGWLRSIFVRAVREDMQAVLVADWLGERIVFPEDVRRTVLGGKERIVIEAKIDLRAAFGDALLGGRWFATVSARRYRSSIVEVAC